jgi:hypothetical protein
MACRWFELLAKSRLAGADADVLYALWEEAGRYEPAFASRLVATVDPAQPIWDRFAMTNTACGRRPTRPDKLAKAVKLYQQIGDRYAAHLASPAGQRMLEIFAEEAPDLDDIGALKKLEFVLHYARVEHRFLTVAGQTGVSASHPA